MKKILTGFKLIFTKAIFWSGGSETLVLYAAAVMNGLNFAYQSPELNPCTIHSSALSQLQYKPFRPLWSGRNQMVGHCWALLTLLDLRRINVHFASTKYFRTDLAIIVLHTHYIYCNKTLRYEIWGRGILEQGRLRDEYWSMGGLKISIGAREVGR